MELVRNFKNLTKTNAPIAGGKGASLGEMTKAGIPVPPGFVVLSNSFERFIEETGIHIEIDAILSKVDHKEVSSVERASVDIQALIISRDMPLDIQSGIMTEFKALGAQWVAVRSSATAEDGAEHAWAGQLDSFLNTSEGKLLEKVKHCWASLFTPRAIFYRFEKGLHTTQISVAVVVQKMVESEISGIAFSVHPVTEDRNQLIIEAGYGLGEAIVSGQITPDSYVVEKSSRSLHEINISTQERALFRAAGGGNEWREISEPKASSQVLTGEQILKLSDIIIGIEKHYGFPCDIEWAYEGGKFYIVQSRPITTLSNVADEKSSEIKKNEHGVTLESPELKGFDPNEFVFVGLWKNDVFATCFWQDCYVPEVIENLGLKMSNLGVLNLAGGNYFSSKIVARDVEGQVCPKIDAMDPEIFDTMVVASQKYFDWGLKMGDVLNKAEPSLKNFNVFVDAAKKLNLIWLLGATYLNEIAEKRFQDAVIEDGFPADKVLDLVPKIATPLHDYTKGLTELSKEIKGRSFNEIKKDKSVYKKLADHAKKYPWIEIMNFIGKPMTAERLFEQVTHFKQPAHESNLSKKPLSKKLQFAAKVMHDCGYVKQGGAEYFIMFSEKCLPFLQRIADTIGLSYRELMVLSVHEISQALSKHLSLDEVKEKTNRRVGTSDWMVWNNEEGHMVLVENKNDVFLLKDKMIPKAEKDAKEIKGSIGNPGVYRGPVRIIMNTYDFGKMQNGDVLVTTMTTPDFVVLMQKAGAVVTDIGGLLSHAAIVSREIGKPCVIGSRFATQLLKDGDIVEVDADKGVVKILK